MPHPYSMQGPPGTGKTTVILGIASVLLVPPPTDGSSSAAAASGGAAGGSGPSNLSLQTKKKFKPSSAARGGRVREGNNNKNAAAAGKKASAGPGDGGGLPLADDEEMGRPQPADVKADPWLDPDLAPRPARRVLICAQSNAAVDELVRGLACMILCGLVRVCARMFEHV